MTKKPETGQFPALPHYGVLIESHVHGLGFSTARHSHPYRSLLYVVSGKGKCSIDDRSRDLNLTANTAVILEANQPHQLIDLPRKAMTIIVVYFSQDLADRNRQLVEFLIARQSVLSILPHQAQRIRRTLRHMLHEQDAKPAMYELAVQQDLSSILLYMYRNVAAIEESTKVRTAATSQDRVRQVLNHILEHYYEPQNLSNAAKMAGLSQRQFSNICRKITNASFVKYVNRLRIQKAEDLLTEADMPVTAIAFEVGFEELSTFYRAFKRLNKVPPLVFRQGQRGY